MRGLESYHATVDVYDPWIDVSEAEREYGLTCLAKEPTPGTYDAIVIAVAHQQFLSLGEAGIKALARTDRAVVYDVKGVLPLGSTDGRL